MTDEEKRLARNAQQRDYYHNWGGKKKQQIYYIEHLEKITAQNKAYREVPEHREKMRQYQKAYRARKKAEKLRKEV